MAPWMKKVFVKGIFPRTVETPIGGLCSCLDIQKGKKPSKQLVFFSNKNLPKPKFKKLATNFFIIGHPQKRGKTSSVGERKKKMILSANKSCPFKTTTTAISVKVFSS